MQKNLVFRRELATFASAKLKHRGVEQLVARQAHNLEVACSSPASATIQRIIFFQGLSVFFVSIHLEPH